MEIYEEEYFMTVIADYSIKIEAPDMALGAVIAKNCLAAASDDALLSEVKMAVEGAKNQKDSASFAEIKSAVRNMLRFGSYKPTGRGKPASEYLFNAALEDNFPIINNLVDINNLVSLAYLLPISVLDLEKTNASSYTLRRGYEGENYVFNPAGQAIELKDLLLIAKLPDDVPCGTPVKDSQETKTSGSTKDVIAFIYAPLKYTQQAEDAARRMAELLKTHCGAQTEFALITQ